MNPSRYLRHSAGLITLALLTLWASACSLGSGPRNPLATAGSASQIRIVVINNDFNDATLFSVGNGERRRLGVVTGKSESNYVIPWRITGPLQIEINLLAGGSCTTNSLQVDPGEVLELEILTQRARDGQCFAPRGR
jgi:hypothetical protein